MRAGGARSTGSWRPRSTGWSRWAPRGAGSSPCSVRPSAGAPTRSAADTGHARYFRPSGRPDHALFDLPAFIGARLAAAGIREATSLGLCTYSDPERFYSYRLTTHRAEPDYGRLVSAIALAA